MDRHEQGMGSWVGAHLKALPIFPCLAVVAMMFAFAINNFVGIRRDLEYVPEQAEECFEEGFRAKARITSYYAEVYELCTELDATHPDTLPSLCGNYPSKVYTWRCEDFGAWKRRAETVFAEQIPEFRYACEADASCLCAAMDGDLPEWWDLDDPSRSYIYECRQVYVDGEWVPINDN